MCHVPQVASIFILHWDTYENYYSHSTSPPLAVQLKHAHQFLHGINQSILVSPRHERFTTHTLDFADCIM